MNILVVDDSALALLDFKKKLAHVDHHKHVIYCETVDQAIEVLSEQSIDLAFIDLQMPEKNGADLIVYMESKDHLKDIPIVIITATGEDSLLKTSLESKVSQYIHKPVLVEDLMKIIERYA